MQKLDECRRLLKDVKGDTGFGRHCAAVYGILKNILDTVDIELMDPMDPVPDAPEEYEHEPVVQLASVLPNYTLKEGDLFKIGDDPQLYRATPLVSSKRGVYIGLKQKPVSSDNNSG